MLGTQPSQLNSAAGLSPSWMQWDLPKHCQAAQERRPTTHCPSAPANLPGITYPRNPLSDAFLVPKIWKFNMPAVPKPSPVPAG